MDYNSGDANLYSCYYDTPDLTSMVEPAISRTRMNPLSMPNLRTVVGPGRGWKNFIAGKQDAEIYKYHPLHSDA